MNEEKKTTDKEKDKKVESKTPQSPQKSERQTFEQEEAKRLKYLKWSFIGGLAIGLLFALPYILNHIAFTATACKNVKHSLKDLKE